MRIIHCADLHLDSVMDTNLTSEKAEIRRAELLKTFEKMVEYAKENNVKVILIAGDLFDTSTGWNRQIKSRVRDIIVSAPQIDFLYLRGNHDADDTFCGKERPENLKLFTENWTRYQYENVCIAGREQYGTPNPKDKDFWNPGLCTEQINIVLLHGQAVQGESGVNPQDIPLDLLRDYDIDYLALGHLHEYRLEKLNDRGVFCYSGCLEGRGFDECGRKGFVLLETTESDVKAQFIPFAQREVCCVLVDISEALFEQDIVNRIQEAVGGISSENLVKIQLVGEIVPELDVDLDYLTQKFGDCFFSLKIQDGTKLQIVYENYENDISLKGEFIRQVRNADLSQEDKDRIIRTGIRALIGREFER